MAQERKKNLISLKLLIKRLQNHLQLSKRIETSSTGLECKETVPDDVKEGYFAIVAKNKDGTPTRFVVGLCYLKHPDFLRLLEMAEEEYGFQQRGALAVPCPTDELRRILQEKCWRRWLRSKDARGPSLVC